ncbi:MAG: DUF1864 family protein, partial [Gammaproteobacteria bacterium]|nr:DUF1864 family protein [Gammaproteobacteria bacterium]
MSSSIQALDEWIRKRFLDINTELEEYYLTQETLLVHDEKSEKIKISLTDEGNALIADILNNADDIPSTYEGRFYLLGNVGM